MEKIVMTGSKDGFFELLQDALSGQYDITVCDFVNSTIRRHIKMVNPVLVLCVKPLNASVNSVKEIKDEFPDVDVLVICEKGDTTMTKYPGVRPRYLNKPVKMDELKSIMAEMISTKVAITRKKSILAVDDDGTVLRNIKQLIGDEYDMHYATSGNKALSMLEEKEVDLILLDYEMPFMSGYDVMVALRKKEKTKNIPIVFLTGVSDKARIMEVVSYHPAGYLLKPIDHKLLQETLDKILKDE